MAATRRLTTLIRQILQANHRAAIVLGEILGPPLGLQESPPRS